MVKNNIHVLSRAIVLDEEHILLCKTLDLPKSFYFLPGGHIEHGESAEVALLRELREESGAEAMIKKFLGCLEYSFEPGHSSICHNHEYSFIFEAESPVLKIGKQIPKLENHIELLWLPLGKISEIDFRPEPLRTLIPGWLESSENKNAFQSAML